jgi:hypothetical protein
MKLTRIVRRRRKPEEIPTARVAIRNHCLTLSGFLHLAPGGPFCVSERNLCFVCGLGPLPLGGWGTGPPFASPPPRSPLARPPLANKNVGLHARHRAGRPLVPLNLSPERTGGVGSTKITTPLVPCVSGADRRVLDKEAGGLRSVRG